MPANTTFAFGSACLIASVCGPQERHVAALERLLVPEHLEVGLVPDLPHPDRHLGVMGLPERAIGSVALHQSRHEPTVGSVPARYRKHVLRMLRRIPARRVEDHREQGHPACRGERDDLVELREVDRDAVHIGELGGLGRRHIAPGLVGLGRLPVEHDADVLDSVADHLVELLREIDLRGRRRPQRAVDHHTHEPVGDVGLGGGRGNGKGESSHQEGQDRAAPRVHDLYNNRRLDWMWFMPNNP